MNSSDKDKIICRGFVYDCELGFHPHERRVHQKIKVDLIAQVDRISYQSSDDINSIRLDYYAANKELGEFLKSRHFNLVETVAEEIARLIISLFKVDLITVCVTKYPMDMPNIESVSYECTRSPYDFKK